MPLSVYQDFFGVDWPLGVVVVAAPGTPVNIMKNVDPANNMAPGTQVGPGFQVNPGPEYTPRCHKIFFQGYHAAANNNGLIQNTGQVYVMRSPGPANNYPGGTGNRADSGAVVAVVPPGGNLTLPAMEYDGETISPYRYTLDADTANEGALVTLINCGR